MEQWTEVRRRVLTGELSKRAACREYDISWHTLAKMLKVNFIFSMINRLKVLLIIIDLSRAP